MRIKILISIIFFGLFSQNIKAKNYYVHSIYGNDLNNGTSKSKAFKTFDPIEKIIFKPGDKIFLANGVEYFSSLKIINQNGTIKNPIVISSIRWKTNDTKLPAIINFKNYANGILIQDCSFVEISNIELTANGFSIIDNSLKMRCGLLLTSKSSKLIESILIQNLNIHDVFYENEGFVRGIDEVKTANGTQKYGWGIRLINESPENLMQNITIKNCNVNSVCHTGIKLTGNKKNIKNVKILNNKVLNTGGPGIQMSEVEVVYVSKNIVSHSGNNTDSRKWGRGSGLWTWGSSNVLIEKNEFLYANGPGDSAGAHIDYNCDNIVLQYNISAFNAGGFCEILGNNYNCVYRYNVSINDGYRIKGVNGAFQEGKVFWLSGYQGDKPRKGPLNSYFYNNTIFSNDTIVAKFAIDKTSKGLVFANNIFCIKGLSKQVLEDQKKIISQENEMVQNVIFKNNLFLNENNWPKSLKISDVSTTFDNPLFANEGGFKIEDYIPKALFLIQNKGIEIPTLPECDFKLLFDLKMEKDILNKKIIGLPSLGAIQLD